MIGIAWLAMVIYDFPVRKYFSKKLKKELTT
jgi:hypothetical protein